jgi:hypothetical protein
LSEEKGMYQKRTSPLKSMYLPAELLDVRAGRLLLYLFTPQEAAPT